MLYHFNVIVGRHCRSMKARSLESLIKTIKAIYGKDVIVSKITFLGAAK